MHSKFSYLMLAAFIITVGLSGCGSDDAPPDTVVRPVRAIYLLGPGELKRRSWPGSAQANLEVSLSFRVSGPLVDLPVKVGQRIRKGELLAKIDPRDYELARDTAGAALNTAKAQADAVRAQLTLVLPARKRSAIADEVSTKFDYEKTKKLFRRKAADEQELVRAKAAYESAQANVAEADALTKATEAELASAHAKIEEAKQAHEHALLNLSRASLRSPFTGEIATKYVENFEIVRTGQRIVRLLDDSRIKFVVNVPEHLISRASDIEEVEIRFDAFPDKTYIATVYEIGTEAASSTRTYPITLIMDQPTDNRILPGMSGEAKATKLKEVLTSEEPMMTIPIASVFESNNGKQQVWIIDDKTKKVTRQNVTIGELGPTGIEVQGLSVGQWVVTAGVHFLEENQQVRILSNEVSK